MSIFFSIPSLPESHSCFEDTWFRVWALGVQGLGFGGLGLRVVA